MVMGVYHDIVRIISNPFKKFKQNIVFCFPLGIGVVISAVLFLIVFKFLFSTYEKATYLLFVGLIAGNLPVILADVRKIGFQKRYLAGGLGTLALVLIFCFFTYDSGHIYAAEGVASGLPYLSLGGFAAGVVALIPGMSVSTVMISMGVYSQILFASEMLLHLNFTYVLQLCCFFACAVAGLVLASKGIKTVFKKYPGFANSMVLGFMTGSLIDILVKSLRIDDPGFTWLLGGVMLAAGLFVSMLFVALGKTMNKDT